MQEDAGKDDIRRASSQHEISLRLHTAFAGDQTITALPHALLGDVLAEKLGPGRYKAFQGGEPLTLTESLSNLDLDDDCRLTVTLTLTFHPHPHPHPHPHHR